VDTSKVLERESLKRLTQIEIPILLALGRKPRALVHHITLNISRAASNPHTRRVVHRNFFQ